VSRAFLEGRCPPQDTTAAQHPSGHPKCQLKASRVIKRIKGNSGGAIRGSQEREDVVAILKNCSNFLPTQSVRLPTHSPGHIIRSTHTQAKRKSTPRRFVGERLQRELGYLQVLPHHTRRRVNNHHSSANNQLPPQDTTRCACAPSVEPVATPAVTRTRERAATLKPL
jgi:hypothetical protein